MTQIQCLKVYAPATLANLGSGLDCIGIAIDLWNELIVEIREDQQGWSVDIDGEGANSLPRDQENVILQAVQHMFKKYARSFPSLHFVCKNRIPLNRGLGSSSAAYVSGLIAGYAFAHNTLRIDKQEIYEIACDMEGHPDNVGPAIFGGVQLTLNEMTRSLAQKDENDLQGEEMCTTERKEGLIAHPLSIKVKYQPNFECVIFVPSLHLKTTLSRQALPAMISLKDAIYNVGRAALLVNTLINGNLDDLRVAMMDRLHQPYRMTHVPYLPAFIKAALTADAKGACLSGSGPSVLAIVATAEKKNPSTLSFSPNTSPSDAAKVSLAFHQEAQQQQIDGNVFTISPILEGAYCILYSKSL